MNIHDLNAREIVRQSRDPRSGARTVAATGLSAGRTGTNAGHVPSTHVVDGQVRRLFLIDYSPMDDASYYLGGDPTQND